MFAEQFWSAGYSEGLENLFTKLDQGCIENQEVLALAVARAEAEEAYGTRLSELPRTVPPNKRGFARDDGATIRRSFEGMVAEMAKEGERRIQIAETIRRMVLQPFGQWSENHRKRIEHSQVVLRKKVKQYERELTEVEKSQKRYFNRCRVDEDSRENTQGDPESHADSEESSVADTSDAPTSEELLLSGKHYSSDEAQSLVARMLNEVPQAPLRVPILGTYDNCSSGSEIVAWLIKNGEFAHVGTAEQAGQGLVEAGLLRAVGVAGVGTRFANSSVMRYQWRPKAWEFAGLRHDSSFLGTLHGLGSTREDKAATARELDQKYRKNVAILDNVRCDLEETMSDHLMFLERCERDRLRAVKAVMLDLVAALSNGVPATQASVDRLLLFHETADPDQDLRFLVETYQTGAFQPRVVVYDNYYSSVDGASVFGTDLELRSRGDRKPVPAIVAAALSHMDACYPTMEDDKARLACWTGATSVSLSKQHALRRDINHFTKAEQFRKVFQSVDPPIVAATLRLYLLELPESVIPAQFYDALKSVYQTYSGADNRPHRVTALQNTLAQLRLSHIATLDALSAHLKRLITIANAKFEDVALICRVWGPALCRPRSPSALALADTHPQFVLEDLAAERSTIFSEVKRMTSGVRTFSNGMNSREGSVSTRSREASISRTQSRETSDSTPRSREPSISTTRSRETSLQYSESRDLKSDGSKEPGETSTPNHTFEASDNRQFVDASEEPEFP